MAEGRSTDELEEGAKRELGGLLGLEAGPGVPAILYVSVYQAERGLGLL